MEIQYQIDQIGEPQLNELKHYFRNLSDFTTDVFNLPSWSALYLSNRPFIDSINYKYFHLFWDTLEESSITILPYPTVQGEKFLKLSCLSRFYFFDMLMDKYHFRYTGGVAYGTRHDWALYVDADLHVLFLGFDIKLSQSVAEIFAGNKRILNPSELNELIREHRSFLNGGEIESVSNE
ncbi:MAG TPA: hypothetical protein VI603_00790 [Saprospiraceae bacterium]|nr:hypothetical protein [Saprospiraceae bacterium]